MKKILYTVCILALLSGCASNSILNQEGSNYVRTGVFKDSFDHQQYNYIETGKTISFDKHNSINAFGGVQSSASEKVFDFEYNPDIFFKYLRKSV